MPDDRNFSCLRERMAIIVGRIIKRHLKWFRDIFQDCSNSHILHENSMEACQKSVIINLGVSDENPSTTEGAIGMYEQLQKYVPSVSTSPFTVVVYGDGLSCERGNDAQRARCNGINLWGRLECVEPSAQEFHKEMLLLQVYYDDLFKGSSASDRGTLCQLKNIFNFRKVKSDVVSDNFNYALELMCLITEGFICLLTMSLLEMETDESVPANIPIIAETSTLDERQKYFKKSALQFSGKYCPKWISCL